MKVPLISHNLEKWSKMIIEIQYKLNKWVVILVFFNFVQLHLPLIFLFQQFLATQLIMQTSESGISAKSLRGRESTRKQDAAEKVSQKYLWRAWTITAICVEPQNLHYYFKKKLCNELIIQIWLELEIPGHHCQLYIVRVNSGLGWNFGYIPSFIYVGWKDKSRVI